jgi:hypothetical protein
MFMIAFVVTNTRDRRYGMSDVPHLSPRYESAKAESPVGRTLKVTVSIAPDGIYKGLVIVAPTTTGQHANSSLCPAQFGVHPDECDW